VTAELAAFFATDPPRDDTTWRQTIESARETLAGLERTLQADNESVREKQTKTAAWVSALVEKLVSAAEVETEAAVERTRAAAQAQAQIQITEARALVTQLQAEVEDQRAEVSRMRQQLDVEKAAHSRLAAAFQTVQRAVSLAGPVDPGPEPTSPTSPAPRKPDSNRERRGAHDSERESADLRSVDAAMEAAETSALMSPVNRPLKLVSTTSGAELHPELVEYVKQLLGQIESIYQADLGAGMGPADLVARLTENLRYAHDVFGRRLASTSGGDMTLFDDELTRLLDAKSETSFGRHLAIAAYNYLPPESELGRFRSEAS
jgi:hypothetical protein